MFQFRTFFYPGNFLAKDFYAILSLQHIQLHIQILITRTHPCITENLSFNFFIHQGHFLPIIKNFSQKYKCYPNC